MGDLTDLLFELSSPLRLRILKALHVSSYRVSQLAEQLAITNQECSRHIGRLVETGLIQRVPDGEYSLTPFGLATLENLKVHEFTNTHSDYFIRHDLNILPIHFLHRIGELTKCIYTDEVMEIVYDIQKMVEEAEEYVYRITDRYLFNLVPAISDAINRGVEFKLIEQVDVNYTETYDPGVLRELIPGAVHIVEDAPVFLGMNENRVAALGFRIVDGRFDYFGFKSSDPEFHNWCKELFEYYWDETEGKDEYNERRRKMEASSGRQPSRL